MVSINLPLTIDVVKLGKQKAYLQSHISKNAGLIEEDKLKAFEGLLHLLDLVQNEVTKKLKGDNRVKKATRRTAHS